MENYDNTYLNFSALKQRFEHHMRFFASTPSINETQFFIFLKYLQDNYRNDPDIQLVFNISNNIQNLNNNNDPNKVEYFIRNLSITNVKTDFLLTLILKQIDVNRNYELEKRIEDLEKRIEVLENNL